MLAGMKKQKQQKTKADIRWGYPLITTGIMIFFIVAASFGVTNYISRMEEQRSFDRLYEEAGNLADTIEMYAKNDREELEMLSAVLSQHQDFSSPDLWKLLDSYTNIGMMSRIELLLPGDIVLTEGGRRIEAGGQLSFEEEAAKGIHITNRETDILDSSTYVVRHYVPVKQDGQTVAMLYGVILPGELPEGINLNAYGEKAALYIIDGKTGEFLIDTWHPGATGNIWALGEREMAPGYNADQLRQGVANGESRYVVFVSKTIGEYLYFYYEPMDINDWRIALSVPESVVFESANAIEQILRIFLGFELLCFVVYLLWMMRYVRSVTNEKQKRFDTLNHIYDVEQLLFNAHEKSENIYAALEKLGGILPAEKISFWILSEEEDGKWYFWEDGKPAGERRAADGRETAGRFLEFFAAGNEMYESYRESELKKLIPAGELSDIRNVIAVPIEDVGGGICGILAACNTKKGHEPAMLLKNMQFSFGMFCKNLKSYTEIQKQGDHDALTGLYNRNRYERDLPGIFAQHRSSLACVYIDANGLHEMNNSHGHDKGDEMLRTVAEEIRKHFDTEYIYRTGGDEFVLFVPDAAEADLEMRSEALNSDLTKADYNISVGIQCGQDISSMSLLIKGAEQKMYAEKKKYYEKHDRRRR